MVGRFGSREICDVTFKATAEGQKIGKKEFHKGQPVFVIDTATASSMEQATTTVYAQGGKGYNRLVTWEGEKTVTFNVTDALISPLGLAMLTNAGLGNATDKDLKHIHMTYDLSLDESGEGKLTLAKLKNELGISADNLYVCYEDEFKPYATVLDSNGAIIDWVDSSDITITSNATSTYPGTVQVDEDNEAKVAVVYLPEGETTKVALKNKTVKLDFYLVMDNKATQITIKPNDFGGTFYVEADTLYRNQDGIDMAATLTFPKAKIQSGFTLSMAPTGDPATFDFVMDCMPGYTYFDTETKVVCDIVIVGEDTDKDVKNPHKPHKEESKTEGGNDTPSTDPVVPVTPAITHSDFTADGNLEIAVTGLEENASVKVKITGTDGTEVEVNGTVEGGKITISATDLDGIDSSNFSSVELAD